MTLASTSIKWAWLMQPEDCIQKIICFAGLCVCTIVPSSIRAWSWDFGIWCHHSCPQGRELCPFTPLGSTPLFYWTLALSVPALPPYRWAPPAYKASLLSSALVLGACVPPFHHWAHWACPLRHQALPHNKTSPSLRHYQVPTLTLRFGDEANLVINHALMCLEIRLLVLLCACLCAVPFPFMESQNLGILGILGLLSPFHSWNPRIMARHSPTSHCRSIQSSGQAKSC